MSNEKSSQQTELRKLFVLNKRGRLYVYPTHCLNINLNWINVLNVRAAATKLLDENEKLQTYDFQRFIRHDTKNTNYKMHKFGYIKM